MKMAKASEADISMALELAQALEGLFDRHYPSLPLTKDEADERMDPEPFDSYRAENCRKAIEAIERIFNGGSLFRVAFGMAIICDPANELLDPDADTIERHPKDVALRSKP